ncbi:hypothetical protein [Ktedonospora formicarum]|uniref:hypothetical protein n=1 Tax=Ktedonospora formicarum TaxID=2778364 RepID=UPI001C692592|nr:hypothetical protein [Ktedonospora formicarum]
MCSVLPLGDETPEPARQHGNVPSAGAEDRARRPVVAVLRADHVGRREPSDRPPRDRGDDVDACGPADGQAGTLVEALPQQRDPAEHLVAGLLFADGDRAAKSEALREEDRCPVGAEAHDRVRAGVEAHLLVHVGRRDQLPTDTPLDGPRPGVRCQDDLDAAEAQCHRTLVGDGDAGRAVLPYEVQIARRRVPADPQGVGPTPLILNLDGRFLRFAHDNQPLWVGRECHHSRAGLCTEHSSVA